MRCVFEDTFVACLGRTTAIAAGALGVLLTAGTGQPVLADEPISQQYEFSAGAQVATHAWSTYSGLTVAPFGSMLEDGLRLRVVGGYGAYSYSGLRPVGGGSQLFKFNGTSSFGDLLIGYHQQLGPLTLKVYAGGMATNHVLSPVDPDAEVIGPGFGAKVAIETWWTISELAWSSLDLSYGTVHESYASRLRVGWRLTPPVSVGLEAAAVGDTDGDSGRLGSFVRYEWDGGELSASAGLMTDWASIQKETHGGFATISWMNRF
jgi:Cellulose biosynthesis protein BcsS